MGAPSAPTPPPGGGAPGASVTPPPGPRSRSNPINLEPIFRFGGISLVVLAAVFFVSTAISRGWIGPTAQLSIATLTSLAMIAQSFRFSEARRPWRITMAIGGSAALFVSGVIGHFGLDVIGLDATMAWLGLTVIGFVGLGRAHDAESIAASGAFAAVLGILLFITTGLATGPVLLGLGTVWAITVLIATWEQRWFVARALGASAASFIILLGVIIDPVTTTTDVGAILGIASIIFLAASQLTEYTSSFASSSINGDTASDVPMFAQFEARIAATVTPWAATIMAILIAGSTDVFAAPAEIGWFTVVFGLGVTSLATALASRIHPTMTMLHQLAGLGTATAGFLAVLDGPVLIAVLLSQAVITGALALRNKAPEMVFGASLLASVPALWTLWKLSAAIGGIALDGGELIVTALVVAAVSAGTFLLKNRPGTEHAWMFSWGLYLFWIAAALQELPQPQMAISLAWAASAVLLIVTRRTVWGADAADRFRSVLNVALTTLLITGAKLVFVDLVAVDVLWRAGLFLLIGGTFLRLAFVLPAMLDTSSEQEQAENVGV